MPSERCNGKTLSVTGSVSEPIACDHCAAVFTPKRSTARYCSTRCRVAAHRLPSVPVETAVVPSVPIGTEPEPFSFDKLPANVRDLAMLASGTVSSTRIVEAAAVLHWARNNLPANLYPGWLQECQLTPEEADCIIFVGEGRKSRGQER